MKPQLLIRTITIIVIVLLCAGISVYSFWCLDREESLQDFNLYTLVPQDAVAVLETDYVERLIDDVEQLSCSKDGYYLYVSEIFTYLKNHLHALLDDTPHGLSTQMNRALISSACPTFLEMTLISIPKTFYSSWAADEVSISFSLSSLSLPTLFFSSTFSSIRSVRSEFRCTSSSSPSNSYP